MLLFIMQQWKKVDRCCFCSVELERIWLFSSLARRALDQSNGAMFLNRKLIVQLSTSRFRPQPKESNNSSPKQLMIMPYQQQQQQQLNAVPSQYFDMMPPIDPSPPSFFRPPSPLTQEMNNYYSAMKLNKALKTGNFNRIVARHDPIGFDTGDEQSFGHLC